MRVAVVGSRTITDRARIEDALDTALEMWVHPEDPIVLLSGGAKGVDTVAREIAKDRGYDFLLFKPYHMLDGQAEYSPRYFFVRNKQIADNADVVVAVWDGASSGTKHMIDYCKKHKKRLWVASNET
jgi:predicted Rossmann fold nucleotide-binding protein DprA/Smf involved in DNA uptake